MVEKGDIKLLGAISRKNGQESIRVQLLCRDKDDTSIERLVGFPVGDLVDKHFNGPIADPLRYVADHRDWTVRNNHFRNFKRRLTWSENSSRRKTNTQLVSYVHFVSLL